MAKLVESETNLLNLLPINRWKIKIDKKLIYSVNVYLKYITNIVDSRIKYDIYGQLRKLVKLAKSESYLLNPLQMHAYLVD